MTQDMRAALMEDLLLEAPCTCTEPSGIGLVGHSDDNPSCYLNRANAVLSPPALETAVHENPALPEKDPPCPPRQRC